MLSNWNVTFEIVTPESAEHGDAEERGFVLEGASLRDAISAFGFGYPAHLIGAESANEWPVSGAVRWFEGQTCPDYQTGAEERRALHIPAQITPASRLRLARYLGVLS